MKSCKTSYPFHEFFAGSGLVSCGLSDSFHSVWANDISERKAAVYRANLNTDVFHLGDVSLVKGSDLPEAKLSWASFPCQDLSLAGNIEGIHSRRSGLVWQWVRIIDELGDKAPRVFCLENVAGLVSAHGGNDYRNLHETLSQRGYRVGAVLVNANRFIPQSRPRVFVIGTRGPIPEDLISGEPTWMHPAVVRRIGSSIEDFVWWNAEEPSPRNIGLADIVEHDVFFVFEKIHY